MILKKDLIKLSSDRRLYNVKVPIIGLTGSIATGKSTVSKILSEMGLKVICADSLVKSIYKQKKTIEFVEDNFPMAIKNEEIFFPKLREIFFQSSKNKQLIENYIYSLLPQFFLAKISERDVIIYDVPLLFEKNLDKKVDLSITVYTTRENQIKRLIKRDNIDQKMAKKIISSQLDIEEKRKKSDFVIDNNGNLNQLRKRVESLVDKIFLQPAGSSHS